MAGGRALTWQWQGLVWPQSPEWLLRTGRGEYRSQVIFKKARRLIPALTKNTCSLRPTSLRLNDLDKDGKMKPKAWTNEQAAVCCWVYNHPVSEYSSRGNYMRNRNQTGLQAEKQPYQVHFLSSSIKKKRIRQPLHFLWVSSPGRSQSPSPHWYSHNDSWVS